MRENKNGQKSPWKIIIGICLLCIIGAGIWFVSQKEPIIECERTESGNDKSGESDTKAGEIPDSESEATYVLADVEVVPAGEVIEKQHIDFAQTEKYFTIQEISEDIFQTINGKSYTENDNIGLEDLRYLKVLHYNYNHEIQVGELIVNVKIAEDCKNIFRELFEAEYEIQSMYLMDKFWVGNGVDSDTNSIEHNNTSAFNYRVVPGTSHLSNHARGCAIDLNPLQNPYVKYKADGSFDKYYKDMEKYLDRSSGEKHMITHEDLAYQVFTKYGFTWGGDWNSSKDYQHFEKK